MADRIPTSRVRRGAKLGKLAAGQATRRAGVKLSSVRESEEQRAARTEQAVFAAAEDLVAVLGSMKGLAMKLGQTLSMIDLNMIPAEHRDQFRAKLAALCDQAPVLPFERMRTVIENDFGRAIEEVFARFDQTPIAAASIGQVYRAQLVDGREVAVKVQYPGIDTAVRADVKNLSLVMRMSRGIAPALADNTLVRELAAHFADEVDYRNEARNQQTVAEQYRGHPFIRIPECVPELCTAHVLVTELVTGMAFDRILALSQSDRDRVGEIVFRFYIGSMARFGQFTGDPHPGNLLLAPDGKVIFLDFGLFKRMDPAAVAFELDCARAACEYRGSELRELLIGRGVLSEDSSSTPDECLRYFRDVVGWYVTDAEIRITGDSASTALRAAIDPRGEYFEQWRRQQLPAEHAVALRVDYVTLGLLGKLRASANWYGIAREWLYDDEPRTELGRLEQRWRAGQSVATDGKPRQTHKSD